MDEDLSQVFDSDEIDKAAEVAFAALRNADDDMGRLAMALQTFLRVYSAQGILDNGGLQYFFESDFPGQPPYSLFVEAYRTIEADHAADMLQQAVALFRLPDLHRHAERRRDTMEKLWNDPSEAFAMIDTELCGNEDVWKQLRHYVLAYRREFGLE